MVLVLGGDVMVHELQGWFIEGFTVHTTILTVRTSTCDHVTIGSMSGPQMCLSHFITGVGMSTTEASCQKGAVQSSNEGRASKWTSETVIASMIADVLRHCFSQPLHMIMARRNKSV